jgi:serine-type D-Ala-D-Ala carboxypeptidase
MLKQPSPLVEQANQELQRAAPDTAVAYAAFRDGRWHAEAAGQATTVFDLASLTKPVTAWTCLAAGLPLDRTLASYVPELSKTYAGARTLEQLLSHRAGLQAHVKLYELPHLPLAPEKPGSVFHHAANSVRPECLEASENEVPRDASVDRRANNSTHLSALYSDMSYLLAGLCLQYGTNAFLPAALNSRASAGSKTGNHPGVAMAQITIGPLLGRLPKNAAHLSPLAWLLHAKMGSARSLGTAAIQAAPTEEVAWRGGVLRGVVHDENAWHITKTDVSGHAGLFGTVGSVVRFGIELMNALHGRGAVTVASADLAKRCAETMTLRRPKGDLRLGLDGKSAAGSSAGSRFGQNAVGHLGFTGTSFWLDPDEQVIAVALSNRVHPTRDNNAIRDVRPRVHSLLFDAAIAR